MRWVTYVSPSTGAERAGLLRDGQVHGVDAALADLLPDLAAAADREPVEVLPEEGLVLRAPVPRPPSVRDFLSFEEHARNASAAFGRQVSPVWFRQPVFYFTNPAAIRGPGEPVPVSPGSTAFDYEVEVAAVVGRGGSDLTPEEAEAVIAGYTVFVDWSARDVQGVESQVGLGPAKGKDGATTIGPVLVTPDELGDRWRDGKLHGPLKVDLNGRPFGRADAGVDMTFDFGTLIAHLAKTRNIGAGSILGSGTVSNRDQDGGPGKPIAEGGVGYSCIAEVRVVETLLHGQPRTPFLKHGDRVRIEMLDDHRHSIFGAIEQTVGEPSAL